MTRSAFALVLLIVAAPLSAHHAFDSEFDRSKPIVLRGVVAQVQWSNPHSFLVLEVKEPNGKRVNWWLEGFPAGILQGSGWKKDVTIKQNDEVTVTGWEARDRHGRISVHEVTFADGRTLFFGPGPFLPKP